MRFSPEVPVLPQGRMRAFDLLRDEDGATDEITDAIHSDPALTAAVLLAANSALSAPVDRVGDVGQAIVRVGRETTRQIVSGAMLKATFAISSSVIDVDELWRHVVTTAMLAQDALPGAAGRDAFTAGLLHDVGRMAMVSQAPLGYRRVSELGERGVSVIAAERGIFGIDHAAIGLEVAQTWQLPEEIVSAIGSHHTAGEAAAGEGASLARAVCAARDQAWEMGVGDGVRTPETEQETEEPPVDLNDQQATTNRIMARVDRYCAVIRAA